MDESQPEEPDECMPIAFGVSAATGRPLPLIDAASVGAMQNREVAPTAERTILEGRSETDQRQFALTYEISDPNDLSMTGWGVIFARTCDAAIKEALQPLLDLRKREAGDLFAIFEGDAAPAPGESAADWLGRRRVALDIVAPHMGVPFYLLVVGSPEDIPYEFQYTLDIFWGVGRLNFPETDEYRRYAESVVAYESAPAVPCRRQIALFAPEHDFDAATQLFATRVARALADPNAPYGSIGKKYHFALQTFIGDRADNLHGPASRDSLARILRGEIGGGLPAVLLTGSHGMEFDDDESQRRAQGALVCQDWKGYGAIKREHWFEAADLPAGASLQGLIHFAFACYSAGYPRADNFARAEAKPRKIADEARLARLPQAMLAHPAGGALAVIGHIDRAWAYTFVSRRNSGQVQGFRDVLARLVDGRRIGYATDQFNIRWSALSTELSEAIANYRNEPDRYFTTLANRWVARDDARNYVVLGDPAVRLRVESMPVLEDQVVRAASA
jgi:hypothetical protein